MQEVGRWQRILFAASGHARFFESEKAKSGNLSPRNCRGRFRTQRDASGTSVQSGIAYIPLQHRAVGLYLLEFRLVPVRLCRRVAVLDKGSQDEVADQEIL